MNLASNTKSPYRKFLSTSVSASALLLATMASPALAEDDPQVISAAPVLNSAAQARTSIAANPIVETNRYFMRLMTQIFDGSKELSHTQVAAFARKRQGNVSWTMMDFGDGAVVITQPDTLSVSGFENTSKAEMGILYNYDTKTIDGNSAVANFHNNYVRPQLGRAPTLGSNVSWATQMPLSALGITGISGQQVKLELSREYFTHDGKEMVLLQYKVPAVRFDSASGATVVHWGKGFALTDPGFGNIYASAALHRSVADEGDAQKRPYRYYRAGFASNDDGKMMLNLKRIPQIARIYDDYFGETALQVIPYDDDTDVADQRPVSLAANIDVMALSIAENGANDGGTLASVQVNGDRGDERLNNILDALGAASAAAGNQVVFAPETDRDTVPYEAVNTVQGNGSTSEPRGYGGPPNASGSSSSGFTIPEGTLENLQNSTNQNSDPFANVRGRPNTQATFGNQGDDKTTSPADFVSNVSTTNSVAGTSYSWANIVAGSSEEQEIFLYLAERSKGWKQKTEGLIGELNASARRMLQLENKLKNPSGSWELTPSAKAIENTMIQKGEEFAEASVKFKSNLGYADDLPPSQKGAFLKEAYQEYNLARLDNEYAILGFETITKEESSYQFVSDGFDKSTARALVEEAEEFREIEKALIQNSNEGAYIVSEVKNIPPTRFQTFTKALGTGLDVFGHAMNGYTIGASVANLNNQAGENLSSGAAPKLTRTYGSALNGDQSGFTVSGVLDLGLALDLAGLAGAAASGDVYGAISAATAITTGSVTDIIISAKGLKDINVVNTEAAKLGRDLARRQKEQYIQKSFVLKAQFRETIENLDLAIEGLDAYSDEADQALKDRLAERGIEDPNNKDPNRPDPRFDAETGLPTSRYWTYLKENDPQALVNMGIDPNAPVGGWPNGIGPQDRLTSGGNEQPKSPPTANETNDYPTAPPRDTYVNNNKKDPAEENLGKTSELSQAQLDAIATAQRQAAAQAKLDAEQAERAKDLPPLDNFETPAEREAFYRQQLDAAQAERASGLPSIDNFETPAEREAFYQQKLDDAQAARSEGLPPLDNFETPAEREAFYRQQLDAAQAERTSGLPPVDNFETPAERQAFYQKRLDDAQSQRSKGLPPTDNFKSPEERRIANQTILDNQQAERSKDLPALDSFTNPEDRQAFYQKQLDDSLQERLEASNKATDRERGEPLTISELKTSDLTVSGFDIQKVVFKDVNFDEDNDLFDEDGNLRKVGPDDFEMTAFDAPDISGIEFSNFADDDYPGGNHVPAFGYENMSGTFDGDLSEWAEWLATQDVRKLMQLAIQAGYVPGAPGEVALAAALKDAANLMRQADDDGYRKWAMAAPSCTGYGGCGPQYQERWTMKRSTLALGDILRGDRAFFSTAGLTDISIANLMFMFSIIDFGIDDGDRVNIAVSQFGQSLLNQSLTINTGGTEFSVPVRPGVVAVNLTALNTGEFPPNTAALSIQGVTGGEADQNYSLDEGGTAGLRVNVGGNQ